MGKLRILVVAFSLFLVAGYAQAATWYSPLTGVAVGTDGHDTLILVKPDSPPEAIIVTSTSTSPVGAVDEQWVQIGLPAEGQKQIKGLEVCYQVSTANPGSTFIETVKLTRMTAPDTPFILFESTTPLDSTTPLCQDFSISPKTVKGAITLSLRMVFGDAADSIKIGGIKLVF